MKQIFSLISFTPILGGITLGCWKKEKPPNKPAPPFGPAIGSTYNYYLFRVSTVDPNGDSVSIRFDWGDGNISDWSPFVASGETVSLSHKWSKLGKYIIVAQAKDKKGNVSKWSKACSILINNQPPEAPHQPIGPSLLIKDSVYTFSSFAFDPDGDSVSIRFWWSENDSSDWSKWVRSGDTVTMFHSWKKTGDEIIRVEARDKRGGISDLSEVKEVKVIDKPGTLKWRYKIGGVVSSPAIYEGTIYVCSFTETGEFEADGLYHYECFDHWLYAINKDGTIRWKRHLGLIEGDHPFPVIKGDGEKVVCAGPFCFRPDDGTLTHEYEKEARKGTTYVVDIYYGIVAYNPDGSEKWRLDTLGYGGRMGIGIRIAARYQMGEPPSSFPAIDYDGTIYFGCENNCYAVTHNGKVKWSFSTEGKVFSSPAIGPDGTIYFGSRDGGIYAVDREGKLKWRYGTGEGICSSPAVAADGTVYIGSDDGYLYALSPKGKLKWKYKTGGAIYSSPAIDSDGTVYIGSTDGYLYAIQGSAPLADSPWPKFFYNNFNDAKNYQLGYGDIGGR
jgi:outer membrane protein assembly factor BamB